MQRVLCTSSLSDKPRIFSACGILTLVSAGMGVFAFTDHNIDLEKAALIAAAILVAVTACIFCFIRKMNLNDAESTENRSRAALLSFRGPVTPAEQVKGVIRHLKS